MSEYPWPEILPCPFCNGKAVRRELRWEYFVECLTCYATSRHFYHHGATYGDAIKMWNTRYKPVPSKEAIE